MPDITLRLEGSLDQKPSGFDCPVRPGDELSVIFLEDELGLSRFNYVGGHWKKIFRYAIVTQVSVLGGRNIKKNKRKKLVLHLNKYCSFDVLSSGKHSLCHFIFVMQLLPLYKQCKPALALCILSSLSVYSETAYIEFEGDREKFYIQ